MASTSFYDQLDERISRVIADPEWQPVDSAEASETDTSLGELLAVAADLRMMPSSDFKAKLKADLVGAALPQIAHRVSRTKSRFFPRCAARDTTRIRCIVTASRPRWCCMAQCWH